MPRARKRYEEVGENEDDRQPCFRSYRLSVPFLVWSPYTRFVKSRCSDCRLPNPLRTTVEEGLGSRTLSFRQASKITGIALSRLHHHITRHWSPAVEEPVETACGAAPGPSEPSKPPRPYSYPCVIGVMDQAALARIHAKKYPPVHNISNAWTAMFKAPESPSAASPGRRDGRELRCARLDDHDPDVR